MWYNGKVVVVLGCFSSKSLIVTEIKLKKGWFIMSKKTESKGGDSSAYWKENLRLIKMCLAVWALVSFGFAILLRPMLAGIEVGGTDLGFWFAQQGSIFCFVGIIFFYAKRMNQMDREHDVHDD
jgi:putative solute:sodium symporter small subunit